MLLSSQDLVKRIRTGDQAAWQDFIGRFEGRLLAYAERRLRQRAEAEDVVQEVFLGFLTSLPNYDDRTPVENFLFSIAAYKLTDSLRRQGRRPRLPLLLSTDDHAGAHEPVGPGRRASSMARSREHHVAQEAVLAAAMRSLIEGWTAKGEWERLRCTELLFVRGIANKEVARQLAITEQAVANHKQYVVGRLREAATQARLQTFDEAVFRTDGDTPV